MIGETFLNLAWAIISFSKNAVEFLTTKISLNSLISVLNLLRINTSGMPTEISVISLIGGFSATLFLTIFIIKLIK